MSENENPKSNGSEAIAKEPAKKSGGFALVTAVSGDLQVNGGGGTVIAAGRDARLENGGGLAITAGRDLKLGDGGGFILAAGRQLSVEDGGGAVMVSREITLNRGFAGVVLAARVELGEGSRVLLTPAGAAAFGGAFGLAFALVKLIFGRKRKA
ncbi:MAG TPA: hypothetical protein VH186_06880 [Chloroflexia bacterium]|nr:hypothetical protein [Chloroflexia bacterium]